MASSKKAFTLTLASDADYARSVRKTWAFRPTTRVVESKKAYNRKKENRNWKRDLD